jgi:hypothetical protein
MLQKQTFSCFRNKPEVTLNAVAYSGVRGSGRTPEIRKMKIFLNAPPALAPPKFDPRYVTVYMYNTKKLPRLWITVS